jgi:hypothetical protein
MRDDIIRMAREAGWPSVALDNLLGTEDMHRLERFAALVRADEREACAGLVEDWDSDGPDPRDIAVAIRAKGQT